MTHRVDVAGGRDIVARWCAFAEQRLQYLTELFETGRWRRFYSERAFLENIQEAKTAVEIWRGLATREASPPSEIPVYSPPSDVSISAEADRVCSDEAPFAPALNEPALNETSERVLNLDIIGERYPLLRNAL